MNNKDSLSCTSQSIVISIQNDSVSNPSPSLYLDQLPDIPDSSWLLPTYTSRLEKRKTSQNKKDEKEKELQPQIVQFDISSLPQSSIEDIEETEDGEISDVNSELSLQKNAIINKKRKIPKFEESQRNKKKSMRMHEFQNQKKSVPPSIVVIENPSPPLSKRQKESINRKEKQRQFHSKQEKKVKEITKRPCVFWVCILICNLT